MRISDSIPLAAVAAGKHLPEKRVAFTAANPTAPNTVPAAPMDEAAFRDFYNDTAPKLRAYVRRLCGNAALADDILQDAFYRFLRADISHAPANAPNPVHQCQMKAYLYRTANTLVTDHWRRITRERRWSLKNFFGGETETVSEQTGEGGTIKLFRRLKPQEQTLLWLAYVEGFEHREIAAALHVAEKSVRVLLFRARKKLGDAITKEGLASSTGRKP